MTLSLFLQLMTTLTTAASMWKMGDKSLWGPAIGLFSQVIWVSLIITAELWGLIPTTAIMLFIHIRNFRKWQLENTAH